MKTLSAAATAIVAVVLLCALSTGGQQAARPDFIPDKQPNRIPVLHQWKVMPDGRVVGFPASTRVEEIDALAKRISEGAVELPPGARVIGWEPVEDANSLLPGYAERVATIPTTKGKLDSLANAVSILQGQINVLKVQLEAERAANNAAFKSTDKTLNNHTDNFDALAGEVAYLAQQQQMRKLQPSSDDLKQELDKFKAAACPVLRRAAKGPGRSWDDVAGAMRDQDVQMKLNSACGLP